MSTFSKYGTVKVKLRSFSRDIFYVPLIDANDKFEQFPLQCERKIILFFYDRIRTYVFLFIIKLQLNCQLSQEETFVNIIYLVQYRPIEHRFYTSLVIDHF